MPMVANEMICESEGFDFANGPKNIGPSTRPAACA
jgi:hypothetical protein